MSVCIYNFAPLSIPTPHTHVELTFPLPCSPSSAPFVYTQTIPSALSSLSPHLPSHLLKYGGGAGRTHISELPQSVQARAAPGGAAARPLLTAKLHCSMSKPCCSWHESRDWSRAGITAAHSSRSPCTCPTCPLSWMKTVTSPSPICPKCVSSLSVRRTFCPSSHRHSSPASSSSSSSCCPPPSPSHMLLPSPSPWRCASATWSPREPP